MWTDNIGWNINFNIEAIIINSHLNTFSNV